MSAPDEPTPDQPTPAAVPDPAPDPAPDPTSRARRRIPRVAASRPDVTTVAAVVVPVLAVLVALLVHTTTPPRALGGPPAEVPLSRAAVVCPPGEGSVQVATTTEASGSVELGSGTRTREADVRPGRPTSVRAGDDAVVVSGADDLAPGLLAARFASPPAGVECDAPVFDQWFTGIGAGASHGAVLRFVNPDEGRAVVDVTVLGRDGVVPAPRLRGITLEGRTTRSVRLAAELPRADELAIHVTVVRGRVATSVLDTTRDLGLGRNGDDGLAPQTTPTRTNLLLGVPDAAGPRTLVLANTGTSQGRATISLVTRDAVFAPSGARAIDLPPQSVVTVPVAEVLRSAGSGDEAAVGLQVSSTVPVTSSLSMYVTGDLATTVPAEPLSGAGTTLLPAGTKRLVLGDARAPGVVTVTVRDADGAVLSEERVEVAPGRADTLDLPGRGRLVTVTPARTSVAAVVQVTSGRGATVVRVRQPATTGLVPRVEAGAP